MFNKKLFLAVSFSALVLSQPSNAVIGPIKITLNTEYRTSNPVIGDIATTIKLDKSQIINTGATTFTGLLQTIPSVSFEGGQGNLRALRIRGNEASHTLLLVDGNQVSITGGQPNLDVIPLDQIERIEITKGPFSSLYGPGAIGGVIHVFTDKGINSITSSRIDISAGSKGTTKTNLNTYYKNDKSYLDIALTDFKTDGIDAKGDGDLDPIDRKTLGLNFGTKITDSTDINFNILNTKANIYYDNGIYDVKPDNNLNQINLGVSHDYGKRSKINLDLMRQNTQRMGDKYKLNTYTLINETDFDFSKLSLGLSTTNDKDLTNAKNIKHTDVFTQWQGLVIDNEISLGARVIDHDKFSSHITYNANWARDINSSTRVNASYGSATNLPSHYQNKKNLEHSQTSLKPERSKSFEFGVQNKSKIGLAEFKVYKSKVVDSFDYHYLNYVDYDGYYFNNKTVDITGAELSIKTELLGWNVNTNLDFNRSIDRDTKKQRGRRPNRSISVNLLKSSGKWKRNINWTAKSSAWDGQSETIKLGGYGLLNLSTSYNFTEDLSVYLNRNNALDKNYEMAKGYNTYGKTTTVGLTYNF
jgi:vitamin B12 transporter